MLIFCLWEGDIRLFLILEVAIKPPLKYKNSTEELIKSADHFNNNVDTLNQSSNEGAFLLHRRPLSNQDWNSQLKVLVRDPLLSRILPDVSNMLNVFGNACSFVSHKFNLSEPVKHFSDLIGVFGTKLFLFVNGTVNTLEHLARRNYLSAIGYFLDNLIAALVPQQHTFLARGLSSGTYHLSYSLGLANGKRAKFENLTDHLQHLKQAFAKTYKNIFSKQLLSNFFDSNNAISGILGGVLSIAGVVSWPLFGKKVATLLRDLGGSLKSTNYINPGHILEGRQLYFLSGIFQCSAAVADFCASIFPKTSSYMVPASLLTDGLAKYVLRQSTNKGELGDVE